MSIAQDPRQTLLTIREIEAGLILDDIASFSYPPGDELRYTETGWMKMHPDQPT